MPPLVDGFGREVTYLRVSLTDRCNLRCFYCRPRDVTFAHRSEILSLEEIEELVRIAVGLGVRKIRLTGGEPLVRTGAVDLVRRLAAIPGLDDLALSTNAILLRQLSEPLKAAGLHRINVSLDTLKADIFRRIVGRDDLDEVLAGIRAAAAAGFHPLKLNVVVIRGVNEGELLDLVRFGGSVGAQVRFIEYMPMTGDPLWSERHVSREEIEHRISALLLPAPPRSNGSDPAVYHPLRDGSGEVGIISPVSCRFCNLCNRLRLTADGRLRPCLTSRGEVDVKTALRRSAGRDEVERLFQSAVAAKPEVGDYPDPRTTSPRPMIRIGG